MKMNAKQVETKQFLDEVEKKIINAIQDDFPVVKEPFKELSKRLNIGEEDLLKRIKSLSERKVIRRIGASLNSRAVGLTSTLIGMEVPQDKVDEVAKIINRHHQVTHNYERDGRFNLWFTLVAKSDEELDMLIRQIKEKTGVKRVINLPSNRIFKVKVRFML
jgi:DNA-binding Lrp family transcriptional regulator